LSETDCDQADCSQILAELESFVDREVVPERAEKIKEHLEACGPCLDRAEFRERLRQLVSSKCCSEEVPEALADQILAMLASDPG
jgi:mycothiol system anti-sigma-R factor